MKAIKKKILQNGILTTHIGQGLSEEFYNLDRFPIRGVTEFSTWYSSLARFPNGVLLLISNNLGFLVKLYLLPLLGILPFQPKILRVCFPNLWLGFNVTTKIELCWWYRYANWLRPKILSQIFGKFLVSLFTYLKDISLSCCLSSAPTKKYFSLQLKLQNRPATTLTDMIRDAIDLMKLKFEI